MKIFRASLLTLGALLFHSIGEAADPILIKVKDYPDVGQTSVVRDELNSEMTLRITSAEGKTLNTGRQSESAERLFRETTIRQQSGQYESRVHYDRATETTNKGSRLLPESGKTLLISEKGGEVSIRNEDGSRFDTARSETLSKEMKLRRKIASKNSCLPVTPVAIGQTWSIAPGDASLCFNTLGELEPAGSSAGGKLVRVYEKGGRVFGNIEIDLALRIKNMGPLRFDSPATFNAKVRIDGCIDGSSPDGRASMAGSLEGRSHPQGDSKPAMDVKLQVTAETNTEAGPPS